MMSMESSLPKAATEFQLLLVSTSAGGGHWSRAANATPVPAFRKPKCA